LNPLVITYGDLRAVDDRTWQLEGDVRNHQFEMTAREDADGEVWIEMHSKLRSVKVTLALYDLTSTTTPTSTTSTTSSKELETTFDSLETTTAKSEKGEKTTPNIVLWTVLAGLAFVVVIVIILGICWGVKRRFCPKGRDEEEGRDEQEESQPMNNVTEDRERGGEVEEQV
ncbi:MAG: hypothetical protein JAY75_20160, partial [Candidatus Thiodiazotropha taylori]|nr:hypothetical protein [Candidatus Thiodiazotropha taylori]MCW4310533.1 hypothetical protein [Candidatus Thiodiazotropha endolucinida]